MENQEPLSMPQSPAPVPAPKSSKKWAVILIVSGLILIAATAPFLYQKYFAPQEPTEALIVSEFSDWKTYRNEEYGFEFKYPQNLDLSEVVVGQNSGSKYYHNYVSIDIDTLENFSKLKTFSDSGASLPLFRFGAFNPINKESLPNCFITAKTITIGNISVDVCKESEESMGGPNQMYLNFTKNGLIFSAQSGSYSNENIQIIDKILSTFKFIG